VTESKAAQRPGPAAVREQLTLARSRTPLAGSKPPAPLAQSLPVAGVAVDISLAHLDRPFDYAVTAEQDERARPGARVKVRFAGKEVAGFILDRRGGSDHGGALTPLRRVVSAEPVLSPEVAELTRLVADRYAGTRADVLRLAVPPRHGRVEAEPDTGPGTALEAADPAPPGPHGWSDYPAGRAFLDRLSAGSSPRAVLSALPGADWPRLLADAAAATLSSGRGSLLCVPDHRDVARLDSACAAVLGPDRHVVLTADLGPAARYRAFLAVARGHLRVVIGTRAAVFSPVHDLGLVAVWDDGDDLLAEPRAPYPHAREVLLLRAAGSGCAALVGGFARTPEGQLLLDSGWAQPLAAARATVRARAPRVHVTGEDDSDQARDASARSARLPRQAFDLIRSAVADGPVLVQIPRSGYLPALTCGRCRQPARCTTCAGPLGIGGDTAAPTCRWCDRRAADWRCAHCGSRDLRAPVVGSRRTAEELGRAFPSVTIKSSGADHVLDSVSGEPALVLATPGAEPLADGGFAGALILDTWLTLARPDLRAPQEAVRRWINAAALVRPAADGGRVVLVGDPGSGPVQALVRWDPDGHAARELGERASAHLPPTVRLATISGAAAAVEEFVGALSVPATAQLLGPVDTGEDSVRMVIRSPLAHAADLQRALSVALANRAARKLAPVRVHVDPYDIS
jgi:primosomal protein N' (replication factor Y)